MPFRPSDDGTGYVYTSGYPADSWTTVPVTVASNTTASTLYYTNPQSSITYTTIGGSMPVDSIQQQVSALEARYRALNATPAQHDLLRTYLQYRIQHLTRPEIWSAREVIQNSKRTIERNMERNVRYSRDARYYSYQDNRTLAYQALMNHRREFYQIGQDVAELVARGDHHGLAELINDNDHIRDHDPQSWVDLLNDSDKFPDAPDFDYCSDCNYIEPSDDGTWVYDGDRWICSGCRDNCYHWSDYHGTVVHDDEEEPDEEYDDEEEDEPRIIGGYHSSRRSLGFIPTAFANRKTPIFMGLELEMEVVEASRYEKAEHLLEHIGKYKDDHGNEHQYCLLEDDGSINHGFEMVTGYTGLDVHAKQLAFFKQQWANVKSHDTKTCGLHVHICKKGMTMFHAAKLILFMHDSRNQRLFRAIARRDANRYSQVKNKTADYSWIKHARVRDNSLQRLNDDRYEAVNFQPEKTIEFRLFRGTLRYETIMACLEFTYATWFFTRDTGQQDLTAENFLRYISQPNQRKDTVHLRSFLRSKGFSLDKQAIVKPNPRVEQIKQTEEV